MLKLNKRKINLRLLIYAFLIFVQILLPFILAFLIPTLTNYPPFSEEIDFVKGLEPITHVQQYILMDTIYLITLLIFIKISFKDIFIFLKEYSLQKKINLDLISKVRIKSLKIPTKYFLLQMSAPLLVVFAIGSSISWNFYIILKLIIVYVSTFMLINIITVTILKRILSNVITLTYINSLEYKDSLSKRTSFSKSIAIQLIPFLIAILGIITMLSYANIINEIGESNYQYYSLRTEDINKNILSSGNASRIVKVLDTIPLKDSDDTYFIISPNETITSDGQELSAFFIKYTKMYSERNQGNTYEFYGMDYQGYVIKTQDSKGNDWYIGFRYSVSKTGVISSLILIDLIIIFVYILLISIWSTGISSNIKELSIKMNDIADKNNLDSSGVMPITSTDEIGQLSYAFNRIRDLTSQNIEEIKSSQEVLMEKDRLASLGQLIGGIAHNLKTPIMSISGASQGLKDLTHEYDTSIEDPEVTPVDHHQIAKEMDEWIEKIKTHASYMSDVITTVKGQAVAFSEQEIYAFTMDELVKRVDILMRHELKNALIDMNVTVDVPPELELKGNINSLIQVINNMISNSIQAYAGRTNEHISFSIKKQDKKIIISIKDNAGGIPKDVQEKLLNEMVTTKGKNGTGLGLFMSNSNIKAHFGGNISFKSEEGKGSEFFITIPLE